MFEELGVLAEDVFSINEKAHYHGIDVLAWSWSRPTQSWMTKALRNCISVPLISRIVNRVVGIMLPVMGLPDADVVALWRSRLALMSRAASVSSEIGFHCYFRKCDAV